MSTDRTSPKQGRNRKRSGETAEEFAVQFLVRSLGWRIEERNWRCRSGELDIIAWDGLTLVIVEVRSRSQTMFGTALEAVDEKKIRQLRRVIPCFLARFGHTEEKEVRVDAIALFQQNGRFLSIDHIRGILV